jgi:hypothetical protein
VANSKFGKMPGFHQSNSGTISLQGDRGQASFRSIKIRPIFRPPGLNSCAPVRARESAAGMGFYFSCLPAGPNSRSP